jgi:hypothetical protein
MSGAGPPPPTALELVVLTVFNLGFASTTVGVLGALCLYVGSFFATMTGNMCSDTLYFRGDGFHFMGWCGTLLDKHLSWFCYYTGALIFLPWPPIIFLGWLGLGQVLGSAQDKCGFIFSGRPYPGQTAIRVIAGILFLPFVPTTLAAIYALMILLLVMALLALYALVQLGRYGGLTYFATRLGVRDGMRDAQRRNSR